MSLNLAPGSEKTGGADSLLDVERSLAAARQRLGMLADRLAELRARLGPGAGAGVGNGDRTGGGSAPGGAVPGGPKLG